MEIPLVSLVIPVFCEEETIDEFHSRAKAALSSLAPRYRHELVYVNDGSSDRSLEHLCRIAANDPCVRVLDLSRNFGHQKAITAGIDHASGNAVVLIDADLQDPPEVVREMVAKWEEGFKVVYGQRKGRRGENRFKLLTAKLFYRFIGRLSETKLPLDTGDFRLMDRDVVNVLQEMREESRYIRGIVSWVGFSQFALPYDRDARYAGETKFSLRKMLRFAADGIASFSEKPLKLASQIGFLITALSLLLVLWLILEKIIHPESSIQGWTSVMVTVVFLGGTQLLSIGILGEYIGRIYRETKGRPLYIVNRKIGFGKNG